MASFFFCQVKVNVILDPAQAIKTNSTLHRCVFSASSPGHFTPS